MQVLFRKNYAMPDYKPVSAARRQQKAPFSEHTSAPAATESSTTAHGRPTSGTPRGRGAPARPACPGPLPVRLLHRTAARGVVVVPSRSPCRFQRWWEHLSLPWPLLAPRARARAPEPAPRRESRVASAPPREIPSRWDWDEGNRRRRLRLRGTPPRRMRRRPADSGARRRSV